LQKELFEVRKFVDSKTSGVKINSTINIE